MSFPAEGLPNLLGNCPPYVCFSPCFSSFICKIYYWQPPPHAIPSPFLHHRFHFHHPGGSARALALAASAGPGSKDHTPPPRGLLTPLFTCKTRNPMFCITFPSKTQKNHSVLFGCCCVLHFSVGSGGRICFGKGTVSTEGKRENSPLHLPPHSINNSSKSTEAFNDTGIMTTLFLALSRGQWLWLDSQCWPVAQGT